MRRRTRRRRHAVNRRHSGGGRGCGGRRRVLGRTPTTSHRDSAHLARRLWLLRQSEQLGGVPWRRLVVVVVVVVVGGGVHNGLVRTQLRHELAIDDAVEIVQPLALLVGRARAQRELLGALAPTHHDDLKRFVVAACIEVDQQHAVEGDGVVQLVLVGDRRLPAAQQQVAEEHVVRGAQHFELGDRRLLLRVAVTRRLELGEVVADEKSAPRLTQLQLGGAGDRFDHMLNRQLGGRAGRVVRQRHFVAEQLLQLVLLAAVERGDRRRRRRHILAARHRIARAAH
jgi:hypothetical protein